MKRRDLLKTTALGARAMVARNVTLAGTGVGGQTPRAPASDRVRVGMIGVGGFGFGANLPDFMKNPDVDIAAICDVYDANLDKALGLAGGKPKRVKRHRRVLDDREIDAVVITTPEHWHGLMCIDAFITTRTV